MISGEKILVTGASAEVALPLVRFLSTRNEVWGAARFADPNTRQKVEAAGARPVAIDVAEGDLSTLPTDFTYVLHLAYYRGGADDFDGAMRVNGEGTGRVLQHCRSAKAALVMSSSGIYAPHEDPWYFPKEEEAIGGANVPWSPTSGTSKIAQEAVARFCAHAFALPVVIPRLNTVYGEHSPIYLPNMHMDAIVAGREVTVRWDPMTHTPIHTDEMCNQLEAILDAASCPATVVNWGGDEAVTTQDWCRLAGSFAGTDVKLKLQPVPNTTRSAASDQTKRAAITGPSKIVFAEAYRRIFEARHGA
ncbi:MAG: NAD-dependent epimerase/dehydratase family protein [Acidimicrobiales bacterium]